MRVSRLLCLLVLLAACEGSKGTVSITVVTDPEGDVLERVERLRATLSVPFQVIEAQRDADNRLSLDFDVEASGLVADVFLEGFDSSGEAIAVGRSGPLPLAAIDAEIVIYMAPPMSLSRATVSLDPPRAEVGAADLSYGVLLAGGVGPEGVIGNVNVYSLYLHTLQSGLDMPAARSNPTVIGGSSGYVYMVGGTDSDGAASSLSFAFDTTVSPSGAYRSLAIGEEHARSGASAATIGRDLFLISGDPGLLLDGLQGSARPLLNGEALDGPAVALVAGGSLQVILAGNGVSPGAAIYELGQIQRFPGPDALLRTDHRAVALPTGEALFLGGAIADSAVSSAVFYKPASTSFQTIELLATARRNPAVAITPNYLVVAGGAADDGSVIADMEVFDATTLEPVATIPMIVPRTGAVAKKLANGQVLIIGGRDANGDLTGVLELFTPNN